MKKYINLISVLLFLNLLCFKIFGQVSNNDRFTEIYRSEYLIINQLTANSYQHISFKQTNDFGLVPCNGLIIRDKSEVLIFDTPTNDKSSEELIQWVEVKLGSNIKAIIPTHFHDDCLGGLTAFHKHKIPSFGFKKTIELAKGNGLAIPQNSFNGKKSFKIGNEVIVVDFFGEGHSKDNVVGYFKKDQILFGGCLIKEMNATKGYLGDANILSWSATVEKVKKSFPNLKIIVPGHGQPGDSRLLDYTINLFK